MKEGRLTRKIRNFSMWSSGCSSHTVKAEPGLKQAGPDLQKNVRSPGTAEAALSRHGGGNGINEPWQHQHRQNGTSDQLDPPEFGFQSGYVRLGCDTTGYPIVHGGRDRLSLPLVQPRSRRRRIVAMMSKGISVITGSTACSCQRCASRHFRARRKLEPMV